MGGMKLVGVGAYVKEFGSPTVGVGANVKSVWSSTYVVGVGASVYDVGLL